MCLTESRVFWPVVQEAAGILSLFIHCLLLPHLFDGFDVCSWFSDIGMLDNYFTEEDR